MPLPGDPPSGLVTQYTTGPTSTARSSFVERITCAPPVIVTLPARLDAAAAEQAAGQITAAFTPGVRVVIADLTAPGGKLALVPGA